MEEKGYKFRYQHRIVKDMFGNKVSPDFIVDPNEKYNGNSFIVEVKFRNFDFEKLIKEESPDIIEKIELTNNKWREIQIEGLKCDNDFIYKINDDNKLSHSEYNDFLKILNQLNKYSELINSDCGILLCLNNTFNVQYKNKLIRFIETPLYDTNSLKFYD